VLIAFSIARKSQRPYRVLAVLLSPLLLAAPDQQDDYGEQRKHHHDS
jgi:hypothetical protein